MNGGVADVFTDVDACPGDRRVNYEFVARLGVPVLVLCASE